MYTPQNRCLAVAKIVICHVRILLLVQAKRVFSFLKRKKMHFDVFWSYKKVVWHFRWQARDFLRFRHVLDGIFFFWAVCGAASW